MLVIKKFEIILVLFQINQTNLMNHNLIAQKYGWCSSWAIWKRRDTTQKEKYGMEDVSFFANMDSLPLNPNYVFVGLNISGKGSLERPFSNFHPLHKTAHDYKTRYALQDTQFWGAYMTDIIKDFEEVVGSNVKKYLKANPDFEKSNIELFEQELKDIGSLNPVLIAFGNVSYNILNKHFKNKYTIYKINHYSSCISKEKLREQILNLKI